MLQARSALAALLLLASALSFTDAQAKTGLVKTFRRVTGLEALAQRRNASAALERLEASLVFQRLPFTQQQLFRTLLRREGHNPAVTGSVAGLRKPKVTPGLVDHLIGALSAVAWNDRSQYLSDLTAGMLYSGELDLFAKFLATPAFASASPFERLFFNTGVRNRHGVDSVKAKLEAGEADALKTANPVAALRSLGTVRSLVEWPRWAELGRRLQQEVLTRVVEASGNGSQLVQNVKGACESRLWSTLGPAAREAVIRVLVRRPTYLDMKPGALVGYLANPRYGELRDGLVAVLNAATERPEVPRNDVRLRYVLRALKVGVSPEELREILSAKHAFDATRADPLVDLLWGTPPRLRALGNLPPGQESLYSTRLPMADTSVRPVPDAALRMKVLERATRNRPSDYLLAVVKDATDAFVRLPKEQKRELIALLERAEGQRGEQHLLWEVAQSVPLALRLGATVPEVGVILDAASTRPGTSFTSAINRYYRPETRVLDPRAPRKPDARDEGLRHLVLRHALEHPLSTMLADLQRSPSFSGLGQADKQRVVRLMAFAETHEPRLDGARQLLRQLADPQCSVSFKTGGRIEVQPGRLVVPRHLIPAGGALGLEAGKALLVAYNQARGGDA